MVLCYDALTAVLPDNTADGRRSDAPEADAQSIQAVCLVRPLSARYSNVHNSCEDEVDHAGN